MLSWIFNQQFNLKNLKFPDSKDKSDEREPRIIILCNKPWKKVPLRIQRVIEERLSSGENRGDYYWIFSNSVESQLHSKPVGKFPSNSKITPHDLHLTS
jgi:hypothetical protein